MHPKMPRIGCDWNVTVCGASRAWGALLWARSVGLANAQLFTAVRVEDAPRPQWTLLPRICCLRVSSIVCDKFSTIRWGGVEALWVGRHDVTACVLDPPYQWCPMAHMGRIVLRKAFMHCGFCPRTLRCFLAWELVQFGGLGPTRR